MLPEVESSYAGPKMETETDGKGKSRGKITKDYVDGMRAWFKEGKVSRESIWILLITDSPARPRRRYTDGTRGRLC